MRIYKNDVVKVTVVSAEGKLLAPSVEDSGFTSLAGVISYAKTKVRPGAKKPFVFEIYNKTREEYGRYNNCGGKSSLHIEGKRLSEQKKNLILMVLK